VSTETSFEHYHIPYSACLNNCFILASDPGIRSWHPILASDPGIRSWHPIRASDPGIRSWPRILAADRDITIVLIYVTCAPFTFFGSRKCPTLALSHCFNVVNEATAALGFRELPCGAIDACVLVQGGGLAPRSLVECARSIFPSCAWGKCARRRTVPEQDLFALQAWADERVSGYVLQSYLLLLR
jgi:hypothetical protein